jgi:cyclic pyranopterin phosphate synthase
VGSGGGLRQWYALAVIRLPAASELLVDRFGRRIQYLRISVTDRCNLRCSYCMPEGPGEWEERSDHLTAEEIERVVRVASGLGVTRIRLTGGEPLMRRDLPDIVARVAAIPGIDDLSLTTNGVFLGRLAEPLRGAGLQRINVSLDSLDAHTFDSITGRSGHLAEVLAGIEAAVAAGLHPVKVNIVALKGVNGDEILEFVAFARRTGVMLRFIEEMPMGRPEAWRPDHYLSCAEIERRIGSEFPLEPVDGIIGNGPARHVRIRGSATTIGFITPISSNFCPACNRMRITPDGFIRPCLSPCDEHDLRTPLRSGADDEAIARVFREAVAVKPERHEFQWQAPVVLTRTMSQIGG